MDLKIDKVRSILINIEESYDKLNTIPQSYLTPHMENKLEVALEMITDLEDYFDDSLNELERKILSDKVS